MAQTTINPSDVIPSSFASSLATSLPAEALAALASPINISMMKNGTIGSLMAVQPVFAGGQIINGNKLAKVGEDVRKLQLQLSENEVEKTVEQYFWQLASMQDKLKTVEAVDTMLTAIQKDVDVAVRAGLAMNNDLLQIQLHQNDIESQRLKLQNGISIVRLLIGQYAGLTPTHKPHPLTPSPARPNGTLSSERKGSVYSIAGQQLSRPQKGVNIIDGKKVIKR